MTQAILLPGGVLPAEPAYTGLIAALGGDLDVRFKDLELYAGDQPPADYGLHMEVEGVRRFADAAGFERFHLVGYSAGGAAALEFCATFPDRLLSLTLNEPAFVGAQGLGPGWHAVRAELEGAATTSPDELMAAFVRAQLEEGVEPPPPPPGPPPPWMAKRPAGLRMLMSVFADREPDVETLRSFERPVLYTLGGKSRQEYFANMYDKLAGIFPDIRLERYEDRHHFDPPHRAEPDRMAASLRALWKEAEAV